MSEQVKEEGTFKIKRKPKQLIKDDIIKVDLSKPKTEEKDAIQVGETKKVDVEEQTGSSPGVDEQVSEPKEVSETKEETPIIQEIVEEEKPIEKNVEEGGAIKMGETLFRIADLSQVWVEAEVYEADLELIQEGMAATITLPYLPSKTIEATVDYIYPYLEGDSRTARIRLNLDNENGALKPDMYAEVKLVAEFGHRLVVPEEAVMIAGDSRVVFVDLGEGKLKPVKVKTGRRVNNVIEIVDGLELGDIVVTSGNFLIASETKLKAGIDQW